MVNWDKNVQGAKRDAAQKAYEAKVKAKQDKEAARRAEAKAKKADKQRQLIEGIVEEIDNSEEHSYSRAYDNLCEKGTPTVRDPHVLKFIAEHTDIRVQGTSGERLADALQEVLAPGDEDIGFEDFLKVVRENAVTDSTAVSKFLETCMGQDSIAKSEAVAHALHVAQKMIWVTFEKEKWDVLLEAVSKNLDLSVSLQDFVQACKRLARCARLLQYLEAELPEEGDGLQPLEAKSLKHWQDIADDVVRRLAVRGSRGHQVAPDSSQDELERVLQASLQETGPPSSAQLPVRTPPGLAEPVSTASNSSSSGKHVPQCDLCKAAGGTCFFHAQHASSANSTPAFGFTGGSSSSSSGTARSSSSYPASQFQGEKLMPLREARVELDAAVAAGLVQRLEDAIVAAADAGIHEDELLPAFAKLEEFWQQSALTCK
eukprot:TRINITY_DN105412_c0_g1_i1.p1 TRINITY_DN105412_c0_g1~~TRINITY_DN105412_c0_g1_i1.p1  ORF type:complete len:430 (+),score=120.38 TRINITY_DN105412_c0_g1_i1:61-1350(+)